MAMIRINLLPPRIKKAKAERLMIAIGVAVAIALLSIPISILYIRWVQVSGLKAEIKRIEKARVDEGLTDIIERVEALKKQEKELADKLTALGKATKKQASWIRILETLSISQAKAQDLWFVSLRSKKVVAGIDAGKIELTLQGNAFSIGSINDLSRAMKASELGLEVSEPVIQGSALGTERVLFFTLKILVKTS
jgi:Tfp pilus assembly protein PilN